MKISGNTIVVTGGGSGIGRALAEALMKRGNTVIIAGRRREVLDAVCAANPGMKGLTLDVTSGESIKGFAERLATDFPGVNVLVNNSGVMKVEKIAEGKNGEDAAGIVETNLMGPIRLTAAVLPQLLKQKAATVINTTSGLAFVPLAMTPTYCATKAGMHSYTVSMREQLKGTGVEVLELVPPYVQTELLGEGQAKDPRAMPLAEFIGEVMTILEAGVPGGEVLVERVKMLRFAEREGKFGEVLAMLSGMVPH